ncbi:SDR family NAD(P)-dependent oxidoreductase [Rhodococcus erythropolis]|nr:SDR family NAD(P)-dependent oxidoreductase [Rhodococcus erythropolis]
MTGNGAMSLTGRTALVTGAGNGLGRAIALAYAKKGARVLLVGRSGATLKAVHAEIVELGGQSRVLIGDTSDHHQVDELSRCTADEDVSILVNNAGIGGPVANLIDIEPDEWDAVFSVNVRGVYLMCRAFLPPMIVGGRGDIINLASVTGKRPLQARTPYAASKLAVIGLTRTLAWEVGRQGVKVNTLSPGPVDGPRMDRNFRSEAERSLRSYEEAQEEFISRSAMHRLVLESEVADAAVAILQMPGLTGADIDLSAGMIGN